MACVIPEKKNWYACNAFFYSNMCLWLGLLICFVCLLRNTSAQYTYYDMSFFFLKGLSYLFSFSLEIGCIAIHIKRHNVSPALDSSWWSSMLISRPPASHCTQCFLENLTGRFDTQCLRSIECSLCSCTRCSQLSLAALCISVNTFVSLSLSLSLCLPRLSPASSNLSWPPAVWRGDCSAYKN